MLGLPDLNTITVVSSPAVDVRAAESIGTLGGSVTTVGSDGTQYELIVPAGAVAETTTISLTPTTVTGLETLATSTRFGVEFGPPGLHLEVPATLAIDPPDGADSAAGDLAVAWSDGPGVELRPLWQGFEGRLRIHVPHFSGTVTARAKQFDDAFKAAKAALPQFESALQQLRSTQLASRAPNRRW